MALYSSSCQFAYVNVPANFGNDAPPDFTQNAPPNFSNDVDIPRVGWLGYLGFHSVESVA